MVVINKTEKKRLVPWFCSAEWFYVYNNIYTKESNEFTKLNALNLLKIWKSRTSLLQSGVEGSLIILEALLLEHNKLDEYNTRLIQSTSIMRFLNICAANDNRQGTFYQTAKKRKIPEWIISLRHEAAHSQNLPSKDILNRALNFSLKWLHKNYWQPVSVHIKDYINEPYVDMEYENLKSSLEPFVVNYAYINLTLHPYWNYGTLAGIKDLNVKHAILEDLNSLIEPKTITTSTKISCILCMLWLKIETILKSMVIKKNKYVIAEILLEGDIFLCSIENCNDIFDRQSKRIQKKFLYLWEEMLTKMHNLDMMPALIEQLLQLVDKKQESEHRRIAAACWLHELAKAFQKCVLAQIFSKKNIFEVENKMSNKLHSKLKEKCEQTYPAMKNVLTLSLLSEVPEIFTSIEKFKLHVLDNPNEYSNLYLPELINLNKTLNSKETKEQILKLTKIFVTVDIQNPPSNIYSVEDLCDFRSSKKRKIDSQESEPETEDIFSRWNIIKDAELNKCPIGVLPWQSTSHNPFVNIS